MSNKYIDKNEINSVIQSGINKNNRAPDSYLSEDDSSEYFKQARGNMILKERRREKAERRVNDNHAYRGPARRLTIDRRK